MIIVTVKKDNEEYFLKEEPTKNYYTGKTKTSPSVTTPASARTRTVWRKEQEAYDNKEKVRETCDAGVRVETGAAVAAGQ